MLGWARTPNSCAARVPRQVLPQGAKTRVRVFADKQNFALRARHSHTHTHTYTHHQGSLSECETETRALILIVVLVEGILCRIW